MTFTPSSSAPDALNCVCCDYPITDAAPEALCPECGTPLRQTLAARNFSGCNRSWLITLRNAFVVFIAVCVVNLFLNIHNTFYFLGPDFLWIVHLLNFVFYIITFNAILYLASTLARTAGPDLKPLRQALLWVFVVSVVFDSIYFLLFFFGATPLVYHQAPYIPPNLMLMLMALTSLAGVFMASFILFAPSASQALTL